MASAGEAAPDDVTSPSFMSSELDRALQECGYGVQAWTRLDASPSTGRAEARATVELMDGPALTVVVDDRGFWAADAQEKKYPTLDDLLADRSQAFEGRRQTLLVSKLEDVARERGWPDNAEDAPVESVYKDEQSD